MSRIRIYSANIGSTGTFLFPSYAKLIAALRQDWEIPDWIDTNEIPEWLHKSHGELVDIDEHTIDADNYEEVDV